MKVISLQTNQPCRNETETEGKEKRKSPNFSSYGENVKTLEWVFVGISRTPANVPKIRGCCLVQLVSHHLIIEVRGNIKEYILQQFKTFGRLKVIKAIDL
jgi:hypothetical protein